MKRHWSTIVAAAILLLESTAYAQTMRTGRLFECVVRDTAVTRDDGSLGETDVTRTFSTIHQAFLFDEAQSSLRWISPDRSWQSDTVWQYETVQSGSDENSLLAIRLHKGAGSVVVDMLRVKTWVKGWPFTLLEQEIVYSGTCRKL